MRHVTPEHCPALYCCCQELFLAKGQNLKNYQHISIHTFLVKKNIFCDIIKAIIYSRCNVL